MFQWVNWVHHKVRLISMFQGSNVPMFKSSNNQMFKCSNVQMFKCSNVQMFKCSKGPMVQCQNVQIFKCSITLVILKVFSSEMLYSSTRSRGPVCLQVGLITKLGQSQGSNLHMFQRSNIQMFQCSNVPMFKCSNVLMFKFFNVLMFQCSNVGVMSRYSDPQNMLFSVDGVVYIYKFIFGC